MIKDLHKFRESLSDSFTFGEDGKMFLCLEFQGLRLYKQCKMEDLPIKFQETIKKYIEVDKGMGVGLTYDEKFLFSGISGKSCHKCFETVNKIPHFEIKLKYLSFDYIKNFINENELEVHCKLARKEDEDDVNKIHGWLYVHLDQQKYYEKKDGTDIEEIDEYFFWKGKDKKTLTLEFIYPKSSESIDKKKFRNEIISRFKQDRKEIFADKWKII